MIWTAWRMHKTVGLTFWQSCRASFRRQTSSSLWKISFRCWTNLSRQENTRCSQWLELTTASRRKNLRHWLFRFGTYCQYSAGTAAANWLQVFHHYSSIWNLWLTKTHTDLEHLLLKSSQRSLTSAGIQNKLLHKLNKPDWDCSASVSAMWKDYQNCT